jgi:hypothetical protein
MWENTDDSNVTERPDSGSCASHFPNLVAAGNFHERKTAANAQINPA